MGKRKGEANVEVKSILNKHGFRFNKQFGQNFLTDDDILQGIVQSAGICANDCVLEIGAGAGTLTRALCKAAKKVVACEIDVNLKPVLAETLADQSNVEVKFVDVMKLSMQQIDGFFGGERYKVVANIPYYLTSPLLMNFVENSALVSSMTLTIQKEVADRLASAPNTKDYGAITVAVQAVSDVSVLQVLSRELFFPVPNVDSAVVRLDIRRDKFDVGDAALFRKTVKSAFAMRRKTLVNNLVSGFGFSRTQTEEILKSCLLPQDVRGEALSVEQFVALSKKIGEQISQ